MDKKNIWIFGLFVLIMTLLGWILYIRYSTDDYPVYGHMFGNWMMPLGMIGMGTFWLLIIYVIVRSFKGQNSDNKTAIELLKSRLAKGEISIEEYEMLYKKIKGE